MSVPAGQALGLYISIPFCRSKCTYCNFSSGVYPASDHDRYVARIVEDLRSVQEWAKQSGVRLPRQVDTVYLGGGTPSLLAPELIKRLFSAIRTEFAVDADAEITVECAPGQIADPTLEAMLRAGVNRVSLGVQSFIDREAQVSGRLHTRASTLQTIARLRSAGITNLSIDLIAGLAGQTEASWSESLAVLADLAVPHASVYMLEVDEDSRLGREVLAGGARYFADSVPSDDAIARMYGVAIERLEDACLTQYEISNFSQPGFESRHNLRYWKRRPYLGLGLDASSALPACKPAGSREGFVLRSTTTDDLKDYLAGSCPVDVEWLSAARQHEEAWFLGLRMNAGVDAAEIEQEFGRERADKAMEVVAKLQEDGLLSVTGTKVRLTERGRLLSNDVFQDFLEDAAVASNAD